MLLRALLRPLPHPFEISPNSPLRSLAFFAGAARENADIYLLDMRKLYDVCMFWYFVAFPR